MSLQQRDSVSKNCLKCQFWEPIIKINRFILIQGYALGLGKMSNGNKDKTSFFNTLFFKYKTYFCREVSLASFPMFP